METLHQTFLAAFSDYAVSMQMPLPRFSAMLDGNGFDPSVSVGAFDGDNLVGFIFCAKRLYAGWQTLYDCGTGVIPSHRKRHIGKAMLSALAERRYASRFILEVLTDNAPAIALYEHMGFRRVRELVCYRCDAQSLAADAVMPVLLTDAMPDILFAQTQGLWSYPPTWQNGTATVLRAEKAHIFAVVTDRPLLLGYAILNRTNGSLAQIAVHPDYRGCGIGSTLLYAASTAYAGSCLYAINADARDAALGTALRAWGFVNYAKQYEMALTLR